MKDSPTRKGKGWIVPFTGIFSSIFTVILSVTRSLDSTNLQKRVVNVLVIAPPRKLHTRPTSSREEVVISVIFVTHTHARDTHTRVHHTTLHYTTLHVTHTHKHTHTQPLLSLIHI